MLEGMTKEKKLLWIKRKQIMYFIKLQNRSKPDYLSDKIENSIFKMSDEEIEEKFELFEDDIKKEIWVDCFPMYFHITEFENALMEQLKDYLVSEDNKRSQNIKDFFRNVNKSKASNLTLKEKKNYFG